MAKLNSKLVLIIFIALLVIVVLGIYTGAIGNFWIWLATYIIAHDPILQGLAALIPIAGVFFKPILYLYKHIKSILKCLVKHQKGHSPSTHPPANPSRIVSLIDEIINWLKKNPIPRIIVSLVFAALLMFVPYRVRRTTFIITQPKDGATIRDTIKVDVQGIGAKHDDTVKVYVDDGNEKYEHKEEASIKNGNWSVKNVNLASPDYQYTICAKKTTKDGKTFSTIICPTVKRDKQS